MKVGGQAIIEGVLMMGKKIVIAVRNEKGEIVKEELGRIKNKRILKIPFVRGLFSLFYSMYFGLKGLDRSAEIATGEEMKKSDTFFSIFLAIVLGIGLFILLPVYLTGLLGVKNDEFLFSLVDGFIRLAFFLIYVWVISFMKDVKRVFQYHGAEHKTIHAHENGEELTVENIKKYSTIHPRCGTNFIMIFLIVAIVLFSLFGIYNPLTWGERILVRIIFIPIVASISYELLKLFDKVKFLRFLALPGLLLQKLTTAEPDERQIEVAIESLKFALEGDEEEEVEYIG
ncbi:metal-dependent enzyme [Thermosipho melanesiensis]|uniref:Metal-dependent enzyme-like protein n=2 Tax=Thermosipho melanesiensis TaxID=46541 RepID=A6LLV2_THEM4|nr:DUF1385 domain-containing protein [Thermosipho melanesiensis]ABR30903.1 protein of unknown function DUF1385 [Thermosipho melanesiensis BI429]APT74022.1 metal-dependent enzyme [Thermosipho melanesiensis]OOC35950.1 metal-dependent enzyme [Thermosipho melanesiensis]OOC38452.1 metal-dependent enzyme [Thermosipho melanesiensis]OOC38913.1 metal-dependent enzyme [Thermosipho melanesiensis]